MKYIISTGFDYADEFDYPVCSIFTEDEKKEALTELATNPFTYKEFYFGTNEALSFDSSEIKKMITQAATISADEEKTFLKFYHGVDVDIIGWILED